MKPLVALLTALALATPAFAAAAAPAPWRAGVAARKITREEWEAIQRSCGYKVRPEQGDETLTRVMEILRELEAVPPAENVRDWLYVEDHARALDLIVAEGQPGETYNVGGWNEMSNIDVVHTLCDILDAESPRADKQSYRKQITFVPDRPGHDRPRG